MILSYGFYVTADCQWSAWTSGACSQTCGGGQRTKTRTKTVTEKSSGKCYGARSTSEPCNTQKCPGILVIT